MDQIQKKQSLELLLRREEECSESYSLDRIPEELRELIKQTQSEMREAFTDKKIVEASLK